jgi:hypothetical protein
MTARRPLVIVSGTTSELPDGDSVVGVAAGILTAGSGLIGGGNVSQDRRVDVRLAPNPSGIIFVGTGDDSSIGLDGVAFASGVAALDVADRALASGVSAQSSASTALASGNAGISIGLTALASGNAALSAAAVAQASGNAGIALAVQANGTANQALTQSATAQASGNAAIELALSSSSYTYTTTSTNKILVNRERCAVLNSGVLLTLPSSPAQGSEVTVDVTGPFTDTVVSGNQQPIMSENRNMRIDLAPRTVTLVYTDSTRGWRVY